MNINLNADARLFGLVGPLVRFLSILIDSLLRDEEGDIKITPQERDELIDAGLEILEVILGPVAQVLRERSR